ncbi:Enterochelin esterase [Streptomyces sp. YIM 130001]|uniref:enterochelin esterase n=1 Tax=Streptomyces sp. YIM 130001 TaxID=2259644 RepID=UPI000E654A7C|nr:enterochelin esterase [Streptomyces sp. YIM 130001]RII14266.1 Enterochelin esterase [Streptomyces sp. YIM 130001]
MTSPAPPQDGTGLAADVPIPVVSPAVERLTARIEHASPAERAAAVAEFTRTAHEHGTPLVESLPDDADHCAVTFLWFGHRATRRVLLLANRLIDRDHLAGSLLHRIPDTDIWHLCLRLPRDHRGSYQLVADISPGSPPASADEVQNRLRALSRYGEADPLNPHRIPSRWRDAASSVFALPDAPPQPWADRRPGIERGRLERHRQHSTALGAERDVWVYLPAGAPPPGGLPVLALCDGDMWFGELGLQDTLDALIADGAVPPFAVLAPDAVDNRTRWSELGGRDSYVAFLADELLPWAAGRWGITTDPSRTLVSGQSLGGMTALYAGHVRPDRFGHVLAQSASLWWRPGLAPGVPKTSSGAVPWLVGLVTDGEPRPVTVRLDVGRHEGEMVRQSRALRDALHAKGQRVRLTEYNGGHDYACWRGSLADGLVAVLADGG